MKIPFASKPFLCLAAAASLMAAASVPASCLQTAEVVVRESGLGHCSVDFEAPAPAFRWEELEGDLYDVVKVAGCESVGEPGKPDVPFLGFLLAAPSVCEPSVTCESVQSEEFSGFHLAPCSRLVRADVGDTIALEPRFELDEEQYGADAYYPDSVVKAEFFGVLRGQPLIRVVVFPVRFNPVSKSLQVISRATFTVHFDAKTTESHGSGAGILYSEIGSSSRMVSAVQSCVANPDDVQPILVRDVPGSEEDVTPLAAGSGEYKIAVKENRIYKVTGANMAAAGITLSTIAPARLAVRNLGRDVAILVEDGGDGSFDQSDYLLFWGEAPDSEFTNDNIYWLSFDQGSALRMQEVDAAPAGGAPVATSFVCTSRFEQDTSYWQNFPDSEGEDHYFWGAYVAVPDTETYPFEIHNLSSEVFNATMVVEFRGRTDVQGVNPDHHTKITLNDQLIDDQTWNGKIKLVRTMTCPQSLLRNGRNELKVDYPGDLTLVDQVFFNYFQITYLATFVATAGVLGFSPQETGLTEFRVSGFSSDDVVAFDVTDPLGVRDLANVSVGPDGDGYAVSFQDDTSPEKRYVVAQSSVFKTGTSLLRDDPSSLKSSANRADYIIISHPNFIDAAEGIAQHHAAKGEAVLVADIEDIYDEFSFGLKSPQAIKDFLEYAYESFSGPPPTDVLLVGDANMDYRNRIGREVDFVPTHVYNDPDTEHGIGETPTDNWFVCVDGSDILPDMNVGRICAKRASDVSDVLAKIQAYDNGQASGDWLNRVLFVADEETESVNLNGNLSMFYLPTDYEDTHINYSSYGSGQEAKQAIISNLNQGCLLVNYAGHGNVHLWAQGMFSSGDVATLTNGVRMPFVITLTCLNGFFPYWDSTACMGDVFMRTAGKGAIASWSPTGIESAPNHLILAETFFESVFYDFNCYLGAATTTAKVLGYARGGYRSYFDCIIETFTLFGDPGLALAVPTAPSEPRVTVWTDEQTYYADETINIDVMLENTGGTETRADAYLALDFGGTLLYYPSFGLDPAPIPIDIAPFLKLRLRAASLRVPNPAPAGTYTFFAALTQPGDMSQFIGEISAATFKIR
ncbi:MAG: hypothetical protein JW759_06420 [Candidatus Coatesbacteria bacterium]|nr:hypothetical protein [Candidatus Coatesbacteria bacterium]